MVNPPYCNHSMPESDEQNTHRFGGTKLHALDDKKRITIPAAWRKKEAAFFLHAGRDFVKMTPPDTFYSTSERIAKKSEDLRERRNIVRYFYSSATEVKPDAQGRITIPEDLCKAAGLETEVVVAGAGDRIEIWPPAKWAEFERRESARFQELLEARGE